MALNDHEVRTPTQKRGIETRKRIVAAAKALFSEKGFYSTNTKEIAAEAGVAIGSVYAYFKDKKQIFLEVLRGHIAESKEMIMDRLAAIDFAGDSVQEGIYQLVTALYDAHDLSPAFHREAEAMRYSDPDVEQLHDSFHETFYRDFTAFLTLQKDRLRVTDIDAAAHIVISAAEEIVHASKIFGTVHVEEDRMLSGLADMICRFLLK
jgi:AcrR family transcriptional regulator